MKKIFPLFTVIILFVFLSACVATTKDADDIESNNEVISQLDTASRNTTDTEEDNAISTEEDDAISTEEDDTISAETKDEQYDTEAIIPPEGGEAPLLTIESLTEYQKLLSSEKLPTDFVDYSQIESIGDFKHIVFLSDAYDGDYSWYMYDLIDSTGYELSLYVKKGDENETTEPNSTSNKSVTNINQDNMRTLTDESSGVYVHDEITYHYMYGKLTYIEWEFDAISFELAGVSSPIDKYPSTNNTFIGKLLNFGTAETAIYLIRDVQ